MQLFNIMNDCEEIDFDAKLNHLQSYLLNKTTCTGENNRDFKKKNFRLRYEFKIRWLSSKRTKEIFLKKNEVWLQGVFEVPTSTGRGRPSKHFPELSEPSKRRRTRSLREANETEELAFATQMKLRETGQSQASKVLKEIIDSPQRAKRYKKALADNSQREKLPVFKALAIFVDANLSRKQYEIVRTSDKNLFPCYSILQKAKKQCYPIPESYTATETLAEVNLQDLLNHTAKRLLMYLDDVLDTFTENECTSLELISKWRCDGSQQTQFKQKFMNSSDSDANIFQSSFVPLRLLCKLNNKIICQNPRPSSPRYCRPIKISFVKETLDITQSEIAYMESKINALSKTVVEGDKVLKVKHNLVFTMVDGKVCNAATNTKSTMKCFICGATSKDFNGLSKRNEVDRDAVKFGLSVLHARIRFFESILHLAYKIPIKKWQLRTLSEKILHKERNTEIQEKFKTKLGLIVDVPKAGFGNTNDGNTSRRFFNDPEVAAEITGVNLQLILRFKVILEVLSSGFDIDHLKFESYAYDTAKLYIELYPWYPMTPTIHKILLHGSEVIQNALLRIGQLTEEAAEARNKHFRLYRLNFARKFSRTECNMDVLNRLLLSSDPLITSLRPLPVRKAKSFTKEALDMLVSGLSSSSSLQNHDLTAMSNENEDYEIESDEEEFSSE